MDPDIFLYLIIFTYGLLIGSFLNVCIYRIPRNENIVITRSHCMSCGYKLRWYDLFPVLSYLFLKGRCRKCGEKISVQYALVELLNGLLYILVFYYNGYNLTSVIYCLLTSGLIVISIIDFRTFEIPVGINVFILILGIVRLVLDHENFMLYLVGFFAVSAFLLLIYWLTRGRGIGGGDIKLMAAAGLLIGWKLIILAFFLGCIIGSVIHLLRMKISNEDRVLALGPYLAIGIILALLYGETFIQWYMKISGFNL